MKQELTTIQIALRLASLAFIGFIVNCAGLMIGTADAAVSEGIVTHINGNKVSHDFTLETIGNGDLRIEGANGQRSIKFSLRSDEVASSMKVKVHYVLSPSLIAHLSQLNVILNGFPVAVRRVDKLNLEGDFDVNINPNLLKSYNTLVFQLIGHYTIT